MAQDSITITVSDKDTVDWIRGKVRDGEFASETEAIARSISRMREDEAEEEMWIRKIVADRYDDLKLHPESAIPLDQVVKNIEERRGKRAIVNR